MVNSKPHSISKTDWLVGILIAVIASTLICWRLGLPNTLVFDEVHYVPAGQQFFGAEGWSNNSHPPFAKWLIGLSSYLTNNAAWGWRLPGAILATLSVCSVFAVMRMFGFRVVVALFAALMTLLNQTLLVQARTAMLDIHSLGFFVLSALFLVWSGKRIRSRIGASAGLIISGVFLGLAASSKWSGGIYMVLVWAGIFIWRCTESSPKGMVLPRFLGSGFAGWRRFSFMGTLFRQGIPALIVYILTFAPFLLIDGDWSIVDLHNRMLADVTGELKNHPYQSQWWEWPLMLEPVWYYFEKQTLPNTTAIFLIGNPAIYWAGLPAIIACFVYGILRQDGALLAISSAFLGFWLVYAVIPRDLMFFYYYEQSSFMLGMGIAAFVSRFVKRDLQNIALLIWGLVAAGFFVFFYPVLTAMPFEGDEWLRWRWFSFWS
ncbi:dolichyl-phosphate-mannose--protein mannosyltransferase [Hirschia baltica]|uniref:Polyprenol-phosphate-mannose--protein mannosyltransferase n=1 Tax=Hirschia baltica (strain ATCC 49814 / DSM 5838 / IFAM 1418) TaxID=582402 RepID=C6XQ09_HIRBI|nr:phospholipid carrier-dependent glycosyltransferase [Hirschia baltica]ACT58526.1 glycosyl transferase family 39 [Hirschia baltica ATCC 49814]